MPVYSFPGTRQLQVAPIQTLHLLRMDTIPPCFGPLTPTGVFIYKWKLDLKSNNQSFKVQRFGFEFKSFKFFELFGGGVIAFNTCWLGLNLLLCSVVHFREV